MKNDVQKSIFHQERRSDCIFLLEDFIIQNPDNGRSRKRLVLLLFLTGLLGILDSSRLTHQSGWGVVRVMDKL